MLLRGRHADNLRWGQPRRAENWRVVRLRTADQPAVAHKRGPPQVRTCLGDFIFESTWLMLYKTNIY